MTIIDQSRIVGHDRMSRALRKLQCETFVLTPLTYLGGVFFSISLLAPTWQAAAMVNPILYMVNAFRYGVLGVSDIPIGVAYALILALLALLFAANMWLLSKGRGIRS